MVPCSTVPLAEKSEAAKVLRLMDALDDNDDVHDAYANGDIDAEVLAALEE